MDFKQYFYFIGISIFVPLWIYLFSNKERRKDMLFTGILFGIVATVIEVLYSQNDYWKPVFIIPNIPLEDLYYGLIFGGISSEFYELLFRKYNSKTPTKSYKILIPIIAIFIILSYAILSTYLDLNSIVPTILLGIFILFLVIILRKDLIKMSIINGLFMIILKIVMFQILLIIYPEIFQNHWMTENLLGINILKIPIEELIFAFTVGIGAGPLYELIFGYSILDKKK